LGQLSVIKNEQHIYLDEKRQHFNLTLDRFSICFSPEETVVLQSRYLFLEKPFFCWTLNWQAVSFANYNLLNL